MRKLAIYPEDYRMPVEGATGLAYDEGCQARTRIIERVIAERPKS